VPQSIEVVYAPVFQDLLGTTAPAPQDLLILLPFPFVVWGADELRRYAMRRRVAVPV
jgi:hypothetical protein